MLQLTAEFCNKRYIRLTFNHQSHNKQLSAIPVAVVRRAKSTLDLNLKHTMMININAIFGELSHKWAGLRRRKCSLACVDTGPNTRDWASITSYVLWYYNNNPYIHTTQHIHSRDVHYFICIFKVLSFKSLLTFTNIIYIFWDATLAILCAYHEILVQSPMCLAVTITQPQLSLPVSRGHFLQGSWQILQTLQWVVKFI